MNAAFNCIKLNVFTNEERNTETGYIARLKGENGATLKTWRFDASDAEGSKVVLSFEDVVPKDGGEWYELRVDRTGDGLARVDLMTGNATFCDSYRGTMVVDGIEVEANDLKMDVSYDTEESLVGFCFSAGAEHV